LGAGQQGMESNARFRGTSRMRDADFELPSHSFESSSRHQSRKYPSDKPPWGLLIAVFLFIGLAFGFVRYHDQRLPVPLTTADIATNPNRYYIFV